MRFSELSISARTSSALAEMGYDVATEVQEKTLPLLLQGEELLVRSQTGTGKTAAFGIGLIEIISKDRTKKGLILAPTRELALQITKELRSIAKNHNLKIFAIYGGQGMGSQISLLRQGFDIIIATPGRLLDHVARRTVHLGSVNVVVLDEADQMLDIGFKPDIDRILRQINPNRQILLFSATIDSRIREIAHDYMAMPEMIEIGPVGKVVKIEEEFIKLSRAQKLDKLKEILTREPMSRTLVFVASKHSVEAVCRKLNASNIEAQYIHGGKSQTQRERVMRGFKEGSFRILIATDVAARGIHINDVSHVINYDAADSAHIHTHRIGRTARMGKAGKAITFVETDPLPKKPHRGRGGGHGQHDHGRSPDHRGTPRFHGERGRNRRFR